MRGFVDEYQSIFKLNFYLWPDVAARYTPVVLVRDLIEVEFWEVLRLKKYNTQVDLNISIIIMLYFLLCEMQFTGV